MDEVQNLPDAGKIIKLLFDKYHERVKFILTGSSGLDIRNIGGALVGRMVLFEMHPFSFSEFLDAKHSKLKAYHDEHRIVLSKHCEIEANVVVDELNELLEEYMIYGGYPRIVMIDNIDKKRILLEQLVTSLIEKDVLKVYGQAFRLDALRVMKFLAHNCCHLVNYDDISNQMGIELNKVKKTVDILVDIHVIVLVRPFFKNITTELRKKPKVCFIDCGFRNVLAEEMIFARERGFLLENFVFSQALRNSKKLNYWRTKSKAEVDFIVDGIPVEVKSGGRKTRSLISYLNSYEPKTAYIVDYDVIEVEKIEKTTVMNIPACLL